MCGAGGLFLDRLTQVKPENPRQRGRQRGLNFD